MKHFTTLLLSIVLSFSVNAQTYSRAKILLNGADLERLSELGLDVDHGTYKEGRFFISDFSTDELNRAAFAGFAHEILIADVQTFYVEQNDDPQPAPENVVCPPNFASGFDPITPVNWELGTMGGFLTYQEMLDNLDLMHQLYPNLISARAAIDTFQTIENRPIFWVRMSDNPSIDENEKEILYSAVHHAREPNSLSATIYYMWYLLENYASSTEIQHLLNNTEMYFIPCLNPDGYLYNESTNPNGGGMHRKNRRDVGTTNKGVDLNRNYSHGWGTTGISFNPNNDTYPGTMAFSEAETQAMKWFCENHNFILAFNAHSFSDLLLYPLGTTVAAIADDNDYFERYTGYMAKFNGYVHQKSSDLYAASGDSDDYMYMDDLALKPRIFAVTPEIGPGTDGFWPAINRIEINCKNMVFPNLTMAHLAHRYLIVEDVVPKNLAATTGNFSFKVERIGLDSGAVVVQIVPVQNIASVGSSLSYDLPKIMPVTANFSYILSPTIQFGDTVKYVVETVYPTWTKRDTITKLFGVLPILFMDDAANVSQWSGSWGTQTHTFYSPSSAFSDSENGNSSVDYSSNANRIFQFNETISLASAVDASVSFRAKWDIEADYDYVQFQVSTDNGSSWIGQCGKYTTEGTSANGSVQPDGEPVYEGAKDWVREEISLTDYLGQTILVRFILESDGFVNRDGFYFDDFEVRAKMGTVGLDELQKTFHVFPNPANEFLVISSTEILNQARYTLMDLNGKIHLEGELKKTSNEFKISTQDMSSGIYMLSIQDQTGAIGAPKKVVLIK